MRGKARRNEDNMADIVKLEEMYEKEMELFRTHKEKADTLKKKIEEEKGQAIMKSVKSLNLSPEEFKRFQKALADEKNVRKLIEEMQETKQEKAGTGGEVTDGSGEGTGGTGDGMGESGSGKED